jgi:hypothetical protein
MGLVALVVVASASCSSSTDGASPPAVTSAFDPDAHFADDGAFFDFPWPSDLRLTADGAPDVTPFPNPGVPILDGLKGGALQRKGFPVIPVGYFRFTAKPHERQPDAVVTDGSILLLDLERGGSLPVVAHTPNPDPYVPENLLAVAPRQGIVLAPKRKYAFVVTRALGFDAGSGSTTGAASVTPTAPEGLAALARGEGDARLRDLYAPLWPRLDEVKVARTDVIAATVFTTGDVVAETAALGDAILARYQPALTDFTLAPETFPSVCHVRARIVMPQFQRGTPIFPTEGLFDFGSDGVPIKQRDESVPVSITIPKQPMPAAGYPLVMYFHGSGGVSREFLDGDEPPDGSHWPGPVVGDLGFAMAGAALPISPERVPGAAEIDYVNVNNMIATRDTFRQGIVESRMLLSALLSAQIPASVLAACAGPTLPAGETTFHFDPAHVHAQGQSMGGMYTNLVAATEPRFQLAVPTGAGGFWAWFILETSSIPGASGLISVLLKTTEKLTFLHPALAVAETALEPIDPIASMPRLGKNPLPGHPARPIYEPVGLKDSYFPTDVYDAMALAYGHPRVGDEVWPTMRRAQALEGIDQPLTYPVKDDLRSEDGRPYTGVVVQSAGDGVHDDHGIYRRVDGIVHQYGCFHSTFRDTGTAVVVAPSAIGSPCE